MDIKKLVVEKLQTPPPLQTFEKICQGELVVFYEDVLKCERKSNRQLSDQELDECVVYWTKLKHAKMESLVLTRLQQCNILSETLANVWQFLLQRIRAMTQEEQLDFWTLEVEPWFVLLLHHMEVGESTTTTSEEKLDNTALFEQWLAPRHDKVFQTYLDKEMFERVTAKILPLVNVSTYTRIPSKQQMLELLKRRIVPPPSSFKISESDLCLQIAQEEASSCLYLAKFEFGQEGTFRKMCQMEYATQVVNAADKFWSSILQGSDDEFQEFFKHTSPFYRAILHIASKVRPDNVDIILPFLLC